MRRIGQVVGGRLLEVKKTSLYIEPEVDRQLARRAAQEGITKAELIRRALAAIAAERQRPRPAARGVFEGPADLADDADRHLAESGFGED